VAGQPQGIALTKTGAGMKKFHIILLIINLVLLGSFAAIFIIKANYEFIIYIGVLIAAILLIGLTDRKVQYSNDTLIALTVWAAMHLAGGGVVINGSVLYELMILPLSDSYPILRYDQVVHIWGFAASTLAMFCLLRKLTINPLAHPVMFLVILIMAGLGIGAVNEIVEFIVAQTIPSSGVGGYINTSLDLCADLIGAIIAAIYIKLFHYRQG